MRTVGNILWLVFGGIAMAAAYAVAGLVMFLLIITIPFGVQAFKLAAFSLWPFGRVMVEQPGRANGCLATAGNILWIVLAGVWLAIGHIISAALLALTIVGIPFAVANVRLAAAALVPFGRHVVSKDEAIAQRYRVVVGIDPLG